MRQGMPKLMSPEFTKKKRTAHAAAGSMMLYGTLGS